MVAEGKWIRCVYIYMMMLCVYIYICIYVWARGPQRSLVEMKNENGRTMDGWKNYEEFEMKRKVVKRKFEEEEEVVTNSFTKTVKEYSKEAQQHFTMDVLHDPDGSMTAMVHSLVKEFAGKVEAEEICLRDGYEMKDEAGEAEEAPKRGMQEEEEEEEEEKVQKRLCLKNRRKERQQWREFTA